MKIQKTNPAVGLFIDCLEHQGLSKAQAARDMKIPPARLTEITAETKRISLDTALRFERYFGVEADLWLRLQQRHELRAARAEKKQELKTISPRPSLSKNP